MGITNSLLARLLKATPFQSESLDNLAETMHVSTILKKPKLDRYYKARLRVGGMAFLDRIFFDATYFNTLLPDEMLAVAAHELTHLKKRHGTKKFFRLTVPSALIGVLMSFLVFFNFESIDPIPLVGSLGKVGSSLLAAVFFGFFGLVAALFANAKWLRNQETECDLSSVKYLNGEPMITAMIKLNNLRPKRITRIEQFLPKLYPTIEQRINDIRAAAENKKKQSATANTSPD
jgi:Zn-dependent protease with chaperone function